MRQPTDARRATAISKVLSKLPGPNIRGAYGRIGQAPDKPCIGLPEWAHARLESGPMLEQELAELLVSIPSAGIRTTYRIGTSISPLDVSWMSLGIKILRCESVRVASNKIWWLEMWPALVLRPQTKRCTVALCNSQSAPQRQSAISLSCVRRGRRISRFHLMGSCPSQPTVMNARSR